MLSDFGYEINGWDDFLGAVVCDDIDHWSRLARITRHPPGQGYSIPHHSTYVFVFGLFLGLVPRTPENLCWAIDELPSYLKRNAG